MPVIPTLDMIKALAGTSRARMEEAFQERLKDPEYRAFLHANDEEIRREHAALVAKRAATQA